MAKAKYKTKAKGKSGCVRDSLPPLPACDFFAGSGLVTEALQDYFRVVWANDICERKARVYHANHPGDHLLVGSVTQVKGSDLPPVALSWASFPCQDLSLAGRIDGIESTRSGLVWEWLRVLDESPTMPHVLVAENVTGLVSSNSGRNYLQLHDALVARGYAVGAIVLDAIHFLPQSRPRVFIVAFAQRFPLPDSLCQSGPGWCHSDAIQSVASERATSWIWWKIRKPVPRIGGLESIIEWDAPRDAPSRRDYLLGMISPLHRKELMRRIFDGPAVFPGYRRTRNGSQVLELRFDNVAGCLRTPEGGSSRQVVVLRDAKGMVSTRLLTVRETARLMGAPDSYQLPGNYNDGYKAMGDAVAVPVARWLARHLLHPLCLAAENHEKGYYSEQTFQ